MIQWNKGKPPKDGEVYLVTILTYKGPFAGTRRISVIEWSEDSKAWVSPTYGAELGGHDIIAAWSERNIYQEEE